MQKKVFKVQPKEVKKISLNLAVANDQYCGVGQSGSQSFDWVKLGIFPNASMHWMGNSL